MRIDWEVTEIMLTVTRKAFDFPVMVTGRCLVSLGSLNSSALYRSIIQTAEFSPMCVYLWLYMDARLELHIPGVVSQGIEFCHNLWVSIATELAV